MAQVRRAVQGLLRRVSSETRGAWRKQTVPVLAGGVFLVPTRGPRWRRSSCWFVASTIDVILAWVWKTSRIVAHYPAGLGCL